MGEDTVRVFPPPTSPRWGEAKSPSTLPWTTTREVLFKKSPEKDKGVMQLSTEQHIFITGACGAGKSTLGRALARQLQLPLHRLYEGLRPEIDAFRQCPGVEIVPSRAFKTWLSKQVLTSVFPAPPPRRLCYDGVAQAHTGKAQSREARGWTLSPFWIK